MNQYDVIAVGDATIDTFLQIKEGRIHTRLENGKKELCFPHGEKILVDDCQLLLGGIACNIAVGLSRAGFRVALVAETGDDEFAKTIFAGLEKEKVDISHVIKTPGAHASFSVSISADLDRTLFVHHVPRRHLFSFTNISANWVYLASMGESWHEAYNSVLDFVRDTKTKLAFTPGTTQLRTIDEHVLKVLPVADILFVSKTEAEKIIAAAKKKAIDNLSSEVLLEELQKLGSKTVVITDGARGSYALNSDGKKYFLHTISPHPVEPTGAGDSYASGFLAAIMSGESIPEAMRWGTINATSVIAKVGAQTGLLTREEIKGQLLQNPTFQTREL